MFGGFPSDRLRMPNALFWFQVDLACSAAYWQDENYKSDEAKETAGKEAVSMEQHLQNYREQVNSRG